MPPRFFVDAPLAVSAAPVPLPAAVAHHATRVLRLGAGDPLVLFDGTGGEYHATLVEAAVSVRGALARIRHRLRGFSLALCCATFHESVTDPG